jgi:hypothetical protein
MATPNRPATPRLGVEALEDRSVPAFGGVGGLSIAAGDLFTNVPGIEYVTGAGPGGPPVVKVFDNAGNLLSQFNAFDPSFRGGVNVAVGDMDGDGKLDIVCGAGSGGGPVVTVWHPEGILLNSFFAYDPSFRGGLTVAVGDLNGDFKNEIVAGAGDTGGPMVAVFNLAGIRQSAFFAYEAGFRGGVNVAVGDVNGDGIADIVTGVGNSGGPLVKVFTRTGQLQEAFFAFDPTFRGGVTVAVGNTDGRVGANIFAAPSISPDNFPQIRAFSGFGVLQAGFNPFPPGYTNSVNMAVKDVNQDFFGDLIVVSGEGPTGQVPRIFFGAFNSAAGLNGP